MRDFLEFAKEINGVSWLVAMVLWSVMLYVGLFHTWWIVLGVWALHIVVGLVWSWIASRDGAETLLVTALGALPVFDTAMFVHLVTTI